MKTKARQLLDDVREKEQISNEQMFTEALAIWHHWKVTGDQGVFLDKNGKVTFRFR